MMSQTQKDKTAKRKDPLVRALSFWKLEGQTPRKAHFARVCVSRRRQRSWNHSQQLRNLLRVAGGEGSDATAEAID